MCIYNSLHTILTKLLSDTVHFRLREIFEGLFVSRIHMHMHICVYAYSTLFDGALDLRLFKVNLFLRVCKCQNGALDMNPYASHKNLSAMATQCLVGRLPPAAEGRRKATINHQP